jgi:2,4-dichlorophenol 6-monooxygenase
MGTETFDTDVVVVGMGPTGATTALALATYGTRVQAVSQWNWCANTPRAHIVNQRAVEVLRDLGVEDEVKQYATPWELMGDTLFATSFAGEEIVRLRTWGTGDDRIGDYIRGSPCTLLDVPQPMMEPVLVKNAAERGARMSFNTQYLTHEQDAAGVTVTLKDLISNTEYKVRAKYLVGADGARSAIAEQIGLSFEGELARAGTAYVRFDADLSRYVEHRPSILYWLMNSKAGFGEIGMGLLRVVRPWNEWIAGWGFDMKQGEPDFSPEMVTWQVRTLVGDPDLEIDIKGCSTWYVNQLYAKSYWKWRVFCGGDAVHRHPPSSGLGSNTCLQDAANLAWKLAYVVRGDAGPALLESYSLERAPVGEQIVHRANQSRKDYAPLRTFYDHSATDFVEEGLRKLREPTEQGARLRDELYKALELKNYEFNAQGVELNQRYASNAVIPDPTAGDEVWQRDRQLYLQATTRPGAKLPHAWLVNEKGLRVSSLDVAGKGFFTLFTGIGGVAWVEAAKALALPYLKIVVVGSKPTQDLYGEWYRIRDMHEAGALLVRPDLYVGWRHRNAVWTVDQARKDLIAALRVILGQDIKPTIPQEEPA